MAVQEILDEQSGERLLLDPEIPGQIGWFELLAMARLARRVPENGIVVETGSLFGRSSFVWAKNVHPSVRVVCIDPWIREPWIVERVEKLQSPAMPFSIEAHLHYTRDCPNIERIQGYSPQVVQGRWRQPVDLFFDDGDHDEPGLSRNRDFWMPLIKPGGFLCADEYDADCPACLKKAHEQAIAWGVPVDRVGRVCWLQRPADRRAS